MALFQSVQIEAGMPAINANGFEPITLVGDFVVPAGLAAADVVELVVLPANYVPVDAILATDDMDSNGTPTITLDLGVLSGTAGDDDDARTCGNEAFAASTVGQAGGVARPTKAAFAQLAPSTSDRGIGIKLAAGAATLVTGADVRLTVLARPALNGV